MRGSARERSAGVWELRVELGRDAITGRRRQLSQTFHGGKREADSALAKLITDAGKGAFAGTDARVSDLLDRWLDHSQADLSPTTVRRYRGLIKCHIEAALGQRPLHKVRTSDLDAFYLALVRQVGLAPATVRQVHAVLRRAMSQAVRWGWIATNPAANASPPRIRRADIHPPTPADVIRLIQEADTTNPEFACFLRLGAATGARRGELCALRWSSLDTEARTVLISRSIVEVPGGLLDKDTKTHAARRIAIDPDTFALVSAQACDGRAVTHRRDGTRR
jgi:integrase